LLSSGDLRGAPLSLRVTRDEVGLAFGSFMQFSGTNGDGGGLFAPASSGFSEKYRQQLRWLYIKVYLNRCSVSRIIAGVNMKFILGASSCVCFGAVTNAI
jgi:hypothetical protein